MLELQGQLAAKERQLEGLRKTLGTDEQHFQQRFNSMQAMHALELQEKDKISNQVIMHVVFGPEMIFPTCRII